MCLLQGLLQHNEREGKELFQGNKTGNKLRQGLLAAYKSI